MRISDWSSDVCSSDLLELLEDASAGTSVASRGESGRFYSPLVRSIAESEGISMEELESIAGSGAEGRVTKSDVLAYLEQKKTGTIVSPATGSRTIQAPAVTAGPEEDRKSTRLNSSH